MAEAVTVFWCNTIKQSKQTTTDWNNKDTDDGKLTNMTMMMMTRGQITRKRKNTD